MGIDMGVAIGVFSNPGMSLKGSPVFNLFLMA